MVRSAPPEKVSLPEVMTTPLTAGSATAASTAVLRSWPTDSSMTFIDLPCMSQVRTAIPSASTDQVKFLRFIGVAPLTRAR